MKHFYLSALLLLIFPVIICAQADSSGCPRIDIGGGLSKDTIVECGTECITLTADVLETGLTDSYNVLAVPFNPPYPFNVGNPIFVGIDDIWSGVLNLPFEFCFYGNQYNQVVVGANGVITFDLTHAGNTCCWCSVGATIPTTNEPTCPGFACVQDGVYDLSINGPFHDMDPSQGGNIFWDVLGTAPCRTFVLNFNSVPQFSCNNLRSTSQIVLYENTNVIDVYIGQRQVCGGWNNGNGTIGLQNIDGSQGIAPPGRNTGAWAANNEGWRFTPDVAGAPNFVIDWYDMAGNLLLADSEDYIACLPNDQTDSSYQAMVTYTVCDGNTVSIWDTITLVREIPDDLVINPDTAHICEGDSVLVELRNAISFEWIPHPDISDIYDSNQTFKPGTTDSVTLTEHVYSFRANYPGTCFVDSQVVVIVHPNAQLFGDTVEVCYGDSAKIGASGINVQSYFWSFDPTIVGDRNKDTISVYSEVSNLYEVFGYSDFGCTDTHYVYLLVKPIPSPDAGSNMEVCGYLDTLFGVPEYNNSNRYWHFPEGVTGISFTDSLSDTTQVSVSNSGQYTFYYSEELNGCTGTDSVYYFFYDQPMPDAGPNDSACGGSYFMQATPSIGLGQWSNHDGLASIAFPNDPNTIIYVTPFNGVVEMVWTETNGVCVISDTVYIHFFDLPPANAGPDQEICSLSTIMQATAASGNGTGTWTAVDNNGNPVSVTYSDPNNPNSMVTVPDYDSITFSWTVDLGVCQSEDRVLVVFRETPNTYAGEDDTTCVLCYNLQAISSIGSGTWTSNTTAVFSDVNLPNSNVCVNSFGVYEFYWNESNGICSDEDTVQINFFNAPLVDAGNDTNVCGYLVNLNGSMPGPTGVGTWTAKDVSGNPIAPTFSTNANDRYASADVTNIGYGCYTFYWNIDYKFCEVVDSVFICFYEQPNSDAGNNDSVCGLSGTLAAVPSSGIGTWSSPCGALSFSDLNDPNAVVTSNNYGCCTLIWTEINGDCSDQDSVVFCFYEQPTANAGSNIDTCGFEADLLAVPSVGNGRWFADEVGISFTPSNSPLAKVDVSAQGYGIYNLYWIEDNVICSDTDVVVVGFYEQPVSNAGTNDTVCGLTYMLSAQTSAGLGKWSGNGTFSSTFDPNSSVTVGGYGTYTFGWTETNGPCEDSSTVTIWFFEQPVAEAGSNQDFCALQGQLNAIPSAGNGRWSSPDGAIFGDDTKPNTTVDVSGLGYGTYVFWWKEENDRCGSSDTVVMNFYEQPLAEAGVDDSICGLQYLMTTCVPSVGTGTWSSYSSGVTVANVNDPYTSVNAPDYGCYEFVWTEVNGTCVDSDIIQVCFIEQPIPYAGPDEQFCGDSYTFKGSPAVGVGTWSGPSNAIYSDINDPNSSVDIGSVGLGTYSFYWTDSNEICVDTDEVILTFLDDPEIDCNCDNDTIYTDNPTYHFTDVSPRASAWQWDFGDGSPRSNLRNPSHTYNALGTYKVHLQIWDQFGCDSIHICYITLEDRLRVYIANAFTPNGDLINDTFGPSILGHYPDTYRFQIFDRWGKLVFETRIPGREWDGTIMESSETAQQGVFSYIITYEDYTRTQHQKKGSVSLIR